jgi:energy-converting hydrogenase Eha subunit E
MADKSDQFEPPDFSRILSSQLNEAVGDALGTFSTDLAKKITNVAKNFGAKLGDSARTVEEDIANRSQYHAMRFADSLFKWINKIPGGDILYSALGIGSIKKQMTDNLQPHIQRFLKGGSTSVLEFAKISTRVLGGIGKVVMNVLKSPIFWISTVKRFVEMAVERFVELDAAAGEFRKVTGLIIPQMQSIAFSARKINVELSSYGVTLKDAYDSAVALVTVFQTAQLVTTSMMRSIAQMSNNLGTAVEDSARLFQLFTGLSKQTGAVVDNLIGSTVAFANLAGVPVSQVFKDIAGASSETLIFLGKSPIQLMRTTVEARRLGTTIESMSKSARGFLNFQDSINSEMEASALLGKSVNFQLSRQLAFEGDIEGSRKAALKQIKEIGDFSKLNVYQQEALSKASGMEVGEIIKMTAQEKMLAAVRASGNKKDIEALNAYEKANQKLRKGDGQDLATQGKKLIADRNRQTQMENLGNALKSIWTSLSDALEPIVAILIPVIISLAKGMAVVFQIVGKIISAIVHPIYSIRDGMNGIEDSAARAILVLSLFSSPISAAVKAISLFAGRISVVAMTSKSLMTIVGKIFTVIDKLLTPVKMFVSLIKNLFSVFSTVAGKISFIGKILAPISKVFGFIFGTGLKFVGIFVKAIPIIGWIVTGIQLIYSLWKNFSALMDSSEWANGSIGDKIVLGLQAVGGALYDVLVAPFVAVWNWLKSTFFGNSPSELGLSIVKGISSVGDMIFGFMTSPFTRAWEFVKKLPLVGKLFGAAGDAASKMGGEISAKVEAATSTVVEIKNLDELKQVIDQLTAAVVKLGSSPTAVISKSGNSGNDALAVKVDELINLLKNGAIGVYLDGRLVSKTLANS